MNGFLLDTHAWLWAISSPKKCSAKVRRILNDSSNTLYLSLVSAWEMAIKSSIGKLKLPEATSLDVFISRINADAGVSTLGISLTDISSVQNLKWHHRDPFDRLLIAQAISNNLSIISIDNNLHSYGVKVVW